MNVSMLLLAFFLVIFLVWMRYRKSKPAVVQKQEPVLGEMLEASEEETVPLEEERDVEVVVSDVTPTPQPSAIDQVIVLHLMAAPGEAYAGYQFLQTLLSAGLRFGERNLFHRYLSPTGRGAVHFSVAALTETGAFEISKMGEFSAPGLLFIMPIRHNKNAEKSFALMHEAMKQLADDLGGELCDENRESLTFEKLKALQARIQRAEEKMTTRDLFEEVE